MRITDVQATAVRATRQYPTLIGAARRDPQIHTLHDRSDFILLEVHTDTGLVGLGEMSDIPEGMRLPDGQPVTAQSVGAWLRERLAGMDPWALELLPERLATEGRRTPGLLLCAVDWALYDLMGKAAEVPAFELLGGAIREAALVSYVAFIRDPESLRDEIAQQVAAGFTAFKLKVGLDPERDVAALRVAREIAGDAANIKLDANGAWNADEAIAILRRMEPYQPAGIETPIPPEDLTSMRRVKENTGIPLLEHVSTPGRALAMVQAQAVDVFNVSCTGCGGIFRAKKVIAVAEAAGIPVLLGSTVELGIGTAGQAHLAVSSPAVTWPSDLVGPLVYRQDVVAEHWRWRGSSLEAPQGPGLGVTLDAAKVRSLAE